MSEVHAPHRPTTADLPLRTKMRPDLVTEPGDIAYEAMPEPALFDHRTPTHRITLCDHYGAVHVIPCTTKGQAIVDGLWRLTGSTRTPSLYPHLSLTKYKGYIAYGVLTPSIAPHG